MDINIVLNPKTETFILNLPMRTLTRLLYKLAFRTK